MPNIIKKITSATTTTLITRGVSLSATGGNIQTIRLTNRHATVDVKAHLFLQDSTGAQYDIAIITIPGEGTVVLNESDLSFNRFTYDLRLTTVSGSIDATNYLSVIIR